MWALQPGATSARRSLPSRAGAAAALAFPAVAVLDDFNRADASDLGANWTIDPYGFGDPSPIILGNTATISGGGGVYDGAAWNVAPYGPDLAMCVTIATPPAAQNLGPDLYWGLWLYVRWQQGGTNDSYSVALGPGFGDPGGPAADQTVFYMFKSTQNFAQIAIDPIQVGDKIGIVARGNTIEGWLYRAATGRWTRMASVTDPDLQNASLIGFEMNDDGGALAIDDVSASNLFPAVTLLDDFNRADASDLGASWAVAFGADVAPALVSNAAAVAGADVYSAASWIVADYGPDLAVCATIAAGPSGAFFATIFGRFDAGSGQNYYVNIANGQFFIGNEIDLLVPAIDPFVDLAVGDKIGLVCRGSTIEGWVCRSGTWTKLLEATDSGNGAAGAIGIAFWDAGGTFALDNFSAVDLFPNVVALDNFYRAGAASADPGANWTAYFDNQIAIANDTAVIPAPNTYGGSTWAASNFGPDLAVCVSVAAAPAGDNPSIAIQARQNNGAPDGYIFASLYSYLGTTNLTIGDQETASTTVELPAFPAVGDKLGLVCWGGAIEAWIYDHATGIWSRKIATTSTNTAAGEVSIQLYDTALGLAIDNFSAATL